MFGTPSPNKSLGNPNQEEQAAPCSSLSLEACGSAHETLHMLSRGVSLAVPANFGMSG